MRIILTLGPSVGGIGTHVRDLAEHCVAQGDEVVVIAPQATEEHFDFTSAGATFLPRPALPTLRRVLKDADVVHSHGLKAAALTNLARAPRRKPRHVVTLHNAVLTTGPRAQIAKLLELLAIRPADVVLGASPDLVHRAKTLGVKHTALTPIPAPPLPTPTRSRAQIRADLRLADKEALLLSVGRLAPQKSLPLLLDALAALHDVPLKLAIAGDGPDRAALASRIKAENLPVTLLGHQPPNAIADLLAAADVFVLASRWEARALVIQEALRAGVPVVATAVGGLPDLVGAAALLAPYNDAPALATAIRRALTDTTLRATLHTAGPAQAATWPTFTESLDTARAYYLTNPTPEPPPPPARLP